METKEAVKLSIEVWKELVLTGEDKASLTPKVFTKVRGMLDKCPLCELFRRDKKGAAQPYVWGCPNCPLKSCSEDSSFFKWNYSLFNIGLSDTKKYAQQIVDQLEKWLVKNDK